MNLLHLFPENWYKVIWGLGGDGGKVIIFITHWTAQKSSEDSSSSKFCDSKLFCLVTFLRNVLNPPSHTHTHTQIIVRKHSSAHVRQDKKVKLREPACPKAPMNRTKISSLNSDSCYFYLTWKFAMLFFWLQQKDFFSAVRKSDSSIF